MIKNPILRSKKDEMDAEKYERDYLDALSKQSQDIDVDGSGDLEKSKDAATDSDGGEFGAFLDDIGDAIDEEMDVEANLEAGVEVGGDGVALIESNDSYE